MFLTSCTSSSIVFIIPPHLRLCPINVSILRVMYFHNVFTELFLMPGFLLILLRYLLTSALISVPLLLSPVVTLSRLQKDSMCWSRCPSRVAAVSSEPVVQHTITFVFVLYIFPLFCLRTKSVSPIAWFNSYLLLVSNTISSGYLSMTIFVPCIFIFIFVASLYCTY